MKRFFALLSCAALLCMPHAVSDASAATPIAVLQPRALDAATGEPIPNAEIIICETGEYTVTDADGYTPTLTVPFAGDTHDTVTLIAYANGYVPFVLVGCVVYPNRTRFGPDLPLFRADGTLTRPTTIIETPPEAYIDGLLAEFPPMRR